MNELETILAGLAWEYTHNLLAAKYRGMNFVLYTKDNQTYLAAYTKEATDRLSAILFVDVRMDSPAAAAITHNSAYTSPLFAGLAPTDVVSAAILSAFPQLRG